MKTYSAVLSAVDETDTLPRVLAELKRLPLLALILVANGPGEAVARIGRNAGARVIRYPERLGYDVGRAIGAAAADGDGVLFVDADIPFAVADLLPFMGALDDGVDVALNRLDPFIQPLARLHPVNAAKRFLNAVLNRADLGCASLTAVPHALSRTALSLLGPATLAVPPRAQARAVLEGLTVEAVHGVDVVKSNARHPGLNLGRSSPVEQLILGDHLEAIEYVLRHRQNRGGFSDLQRRLDLLPQ
ncbi:MAG: glycosyltransferase [Mycobacterium leprae]